MSPLFRTLQNKFNAHIAFTIEAHKDELPAWSMCLSGTQNEYLYVEDGNPLVFSFALSRDMQKLRALPELNSSPYGRMLAASDRPYERWLEGALGIDPSLISAEKIVDAIVSIASTSRMQRLIPHPNDTEIVLLLRRYNAATEEWALEKAMEKLVNATNEANIDFVMSRIPDLDPWVDQDPENAMGTQLILLSHLVQAHPRCLTQAGVHLKRLRREYTNLDGNWDAEIDEIDYLSGLIPRRVQKSGTGNDQGA